MIQNQLFRFQVGFAAILFFGLTSLSAQTGEPTRPKYNVKITDDKTIVVDIENSGPVDPTRRINFSAQGNNFFMQINTIRGETLHLSHFPTFLINGDRKRVV